MKSRPSVTSSIIKKSLLTLVCLGAAETASAQATFTKANNTTAISSAGSWVGGVLPTSADIGLFDSTITTAITTANLGNFTLASLQVTTIGGAVTIGMGTSTFTLNTGGIDMSAATADFTIGTTVNSGFVRIASANYNTPFNVAAGRTLTINSQLTNQGNTKIAQFTGAGNIILNGTSGAGGAMSFNVNGANVTMNGTNSWGSAASTLTSGTLNLGNDAALGTTSTTFNLNGGTLAASGAARTITQGVTLGGAATIGGDNALTVNGALVNSGGNRTLTVNNTALTTFSALNLSNNGTNRTLTINGTGNTTVNGVIANGSTSTAGNLIYSGSGLLSLTAANTFAGTLTASSGTVATSGAGTFGTGNVSVAAGASLTFGNNASIGDLSSLTFASTSTINLNFSGAETVGSVVNSVTSTALADGTYDATQLNAYFGGISAFTGTGSLTVSAVPEPATYAALAGLGILGFAAYRRRRA